MVVPHRCLERARPTPFDAHQFEGQPPGRKARPRASAPPIAPKRASGLLDAGPLRHLERHRCPDLRPSELGEIPASFMSQLGNLASNLFSKPRSAGFRVSRPWHPYTTDNVEETDP